MKNSITTLLILLLVVRFSFSQDQFTNNGNIQLHAGSNVAFYGDIVNNANLLSDSSNVYFNGSATQLIGGTDSANFYNMTLENSVSNDGIVNLKNKMSLGNSVVFDADGQSNSGVFTLKSGSANDSRIDVIPSGSSVTGNVTFEKYFAGTGSKYWRHISSAVVGATVADLQAEIPISGTFTGNDNGTNGIPAGAGASLYLYDNTTGAAQDGLDARWVNYPTSANSEFITTSGSEGRGYAIWMRNTGAVTYNLTASLNQGSVDFLPSGANEGWNLLGNPFPSDISWDSPSGWTKTAIEGNRISIWTGTQYLDWNGSVGTLNSGLIAKGQGFWIKAQNTSVALSASEDVKATENATTYRTFSSEQPTYIDLFVKASGYTDHTYVQFIDTAKFCFDIADASKLNNSIFNLATMSSDSVLLAINVIGGESCSFDIPVKLWNTWDDSYSFGWKVTEDLFNDFTISLTDNYSGNSYDLNGVEENFDFFISKDPATRDENRFLLSFTPTAIGTDISFETAQNCENNGDVTLSLDNSDMDVEYTLWKDKVQIETITGTGTSIVFNIANTYLEAGSNTLIIKASRPYCTSGEEFYVDFDYIAQPEILTVNSTSGCENSAVELNVTQSTNASVYRWYNSESAQQPIAETSETTFTTDALQATTTYFVSAVNDLGCESDRKPVEAIIIKLEKPVIALDTVDNKYFLRSNHEVDNHWYLNNNELIDKTEQSIELNEFGLYHVEVTSVGCSAVSDQYDYKDMVLGFEDSLLHNTVSLYPNPAVDVVYINTSSHDYSDIQIRIFAQDGKIISGLIPVKQNDNGYAIDLFNLKPGAYVVQTYLDNQLFTNRLIKR